MSDDIKPLESRITKIIGEEDRLNRNRRNSLKVNDDRWKEEKRKEDAALATLDTEKQRQVSANTVKEQAFRKLQEKEGSELEDITKGIQAAYIAELEHRKNAMISMQQQLDALEAKMRSIEASRH